MTAAVPACAPALPTGVKNGRGLLWSAAEEAILHRLYPRHGTDGCLPYLPARLPRAIIAKANKLGLLAQSPHRRQADSTPALDAAIRRLYAHGKPGPGKMADFARRTGRPRQWVRSRAIALGAAVPARGGRRWTPAEDQVLRDHEGRGARFLQRRLVAQGITDRSETAIAERCRRLRLQCDDGADRYTVQDIARALGLDGHVIAAWIKRGLLQGAMTVSQDGNPGEWRVTHAALRHFMVANPLEWWPGRCERSWLVDILANGGR